MLKKSRYIDINIGEVSKEMGCTPNDVLIELQSLVDSKDIKALTPYEFHGDYSLIVRESSSIWGSWH